MKKSLLLLVVLLVAVGCSSSPDPTEDFDEILRSQTPDKRESVGLKDDKVMIKKKVHLEGRLWKLNSQINDVENAIYGRSRKDPGGIWESLRICRKRLSDPRIGGNGVPEKMEKWEKVTEKEEDFQYFVNDDKNVIGVTEEELTTRVTRLKKHKSLLDQQFDSFKEKMLLCESKYHAALVHHGIDPADTKSQGEWVAGPGGYREWRVKRKSTHDPEELMRRKNERLAEQAEKVEEQQAE